MKKFHLTATQAQKLLSLKQGATLAYSDLPNHLRDKLLVDEVIVTIVQGMRKSIRIYNPDALDTYLKNKVLPITLKNS